MVGNAYWLEKDAKCTSRPLDSVGRVASELGRLYRSARRGELDKSEAAKLAFILTALRQCLEISAVEDRIAALEENIIRERQPLDSGRLIPFRGAG